MLINEEDDEMPEVGDQDHWKLFRDLRAHHSVFATLVDVIRSKVNFTEWLNSSEIASEVLVWIDKSSWNSSVKSQLPSWQESDNAGVIGMILWNILAVDPVHTWRVVALSDYGKLYKPLRSTPPVSSVSYS